MNVFYKDIQIKHLEIFESQEDLCLPVHKLKVKLIAHRKNDNIFEVIGIKDLTKIFREYLEEEKNYNTKSHFQMIQTGIRPAHLLSVGSHPKTHLSNLIPNSPKVLRNMNIYGF